MFSLFVFLHWSELLLIMYLCFITDHACILKLKIQPIEKDNKRNKELNEFNPETNAYYQYDLYAMVVHGGTMNGGHYVSYVKLKQELKFQKLLKC